MTGSEAVAPINQVEIKRHSFLYDLFRRMIREKPLGTFGLVIVVLLLLTGIFANFLAPYGMNEIHLNERLSHPSVEHLLGTDQLGEDILSRIIYGARISMIIGICATLLSTTIEVAIGTISGFIGGTLDLLIQRFVDMWLSVPAFLALLTLMSIIGNGMFQIIMVLGITSGIGGSRVIRSAVIGIKSNVYVVAAQATGSPMRRIVLRHILPNIMAPIIISFTIGVGGAIMAEAALSFLGYGVPPGVSSWGSMLSNEGRQYMQMMPALALWPGLALTMAVYGINMFGDALRDILDPRLRGGVGRYNLKQGIKRTKIKEFTS